MSVIENKFLACSSLSSLQIQKDTKNSYETKKARLQWLLEQKSFLRNTIYMATDENLLV